MPNSQGDVWPDAFEKIQYLRDLVCTSGGLVGGRIPPTPAGKIGRYIACSLSERNIEHGRSLGHFEKTISKYIAKIQSGKVLPTGESRNRIAQAFNFPKVDRPFDGTIDDFMEMMNGIEIYRMDIDRYWREVRLQTNASSEDLRLKELENIPNVGPRSAVGVYSADNRNDLRVALEISLRRFTLDRYKVSYGFPMVSVDIQSISGEPIEFADALVVNRQEYEWGDLILTNEGTTTKPSFDIRQRDGDIIQGGYRTGKAIGEFKNARPGSVYRIRAFVERSETAVEIEESEHTIPDSKQEILALILKDEIDKSTPAGALDAEAEKDGQLLIAAQVQEVVDCGS